MLDGILPPKKRALRRSLVTRFSVHLTAVHEQIGKIGFVPSHAHPDDNEPFNVTALLKSHIALFS